MSLCSSVRQTPKSILFLARSLDRGGAERQLVALAMGLKAKGHAVSVAVFFSGGVYEAVLARAGVAISNLEKKGRWDVVRFLFDLQRLLRQERPAVLHSYLAVPNILATVMKPLLPGTRIVWGVRASNVDLSRYDGLNRVVYRLESWLARFADQIIANSQAGKRYAMRNGFPGHKMVVIPNGIDTEYFRFDAEGRGLLRREWAIPEHAILVGLIGRIDPMKDHLTFLGAARHIAGVMQNVRFVCVGGGPAEHVSRLQNVAASLDLSGKLIWVGERDDMPAIYSALDVAVSSSISEGFSNTIAEAMACCRPCVVTDVGDSALIVGDRGGVVPAQNHAELAAAILQMSALSPAQRNELGVGCRARIVSEFSLDRLIQQTEQALGLA